MKLFSDENELLDLAHVILDERLKSLENDKKRCLELYLEPSNPAPFPVLLYCFSTVDLLGALMAGNASNTAPTSSQTKDYMKKFMGYTEDQAEILLALYRHKLVHLAQPAPVIDNGGRRISWHVHHEEPSKHLQLEKLTKANWVVLTENVYTDFDYIFHLSITDFVRNLRESVDNPSGYLASLDGSAQMQDNFESAIIDMYLPKKGSPFLARRETL